MYVMVHPKDCDPPHGLDLAGKRDADKVQWLYEVFVKDGFDPKKPAVVAYPLKGRLQFLTGTHRHEAAMRADKELPVRIVLRSVVERTWGTELWAETIRDIPVEELECVEVPEGFRDEIPYEPVNLEEITWC